MGPIHYQFFERLEFGGGRVRWTVEKYRRAANPIVFSRNEAMSNEEGFFRLAEPGNVRSMDYLENRLRDTGTSCRNIFIPAGRNMTQFVDGHAHGGANQRRLIDQWVTIASYTKDITTLNYGSRTCRVRYCTSIQESSNEHWWARSCKKKRRSDLYSISHWDWTERTTRPYSSFTRRSSSQGVPRIDESVR